MYSERRARIPTFARTHALPSTRVSEIFVRFCLPPLLAGLLNQHRVGQQYVPLPETSIPRSLISTPEIASSWRESCFCSPKSRWVVSPSVGQDSAYLDVVCQAGFTRPFSPFALIPAITSIIGERQISPSLHWLLAWSCPRLSRFSFLLGNLHL